MPSYESGSIPGRIWRNRTGWEHPNDDFDYAFTCVAAEFLKRDETNFGQTYRPGILAGGTPTAGVNTISISKLAYKDIYGQYGITTGGEDVSLSTADIGKYVCVTWSSVQTNSQPSIIMGTAAYMYLTYQNIFSKETTPAYGVNVKICEITDVDGIGNVTFSTAPGDASDRSRDEWAPKAPWQSINIGAVMSSSVSGMTEDDMLPIGGVDRKTLFDELNYVKSVLGERWTAGDRYAGAWDDVTEETGKPNAPTGVTLTTGVMNDLLYEGDTHAPTEPSNTKFGFLRITWTAPSEPPNVRRYEVKLVPLQKVGVSDVLQTNYITSYFTHGDETNFTLHNMPAGIKYRVYVRAVSVIGWLSDWSTTAETTIGHTAVPTSPSGDLTVVKLRGGFLLSWNEVVDVSGYAVLAKEGSEPAIANPEDLATTTTTNEGVVMWPYTESEMFFRVYTMDGAGVVSASALSNSGFMSKGVGGLKDDDIERIQKLRNMPSKEIDLKVVEDIGSSGLFGRGKSTGTPVVLTSRCPLGPIWIEYDEAASLLNSAGNTVMLVRIPISMKAFSIQEANFYQQAIADGDFSNAKLQIGMAGTGYVNIDLGDSTSSPLDYNDSIACPANDGELPSAIFTRVSTLDVRIYANDAVVDTEKLHGYLTIWYQHE